MIQKVHIVYILLDQQGKKRINGLIFPSIIYEHLDVICECYDLKLSVKHPLPFMSPKHYCSLTLELLHFSKSRLTSCDTSVETSFPACNCDPTGTRRDENGTLICDAVGGQCECKANVIGQRCDRCAPGSFGFGSEGCTGKWNSTIRIFCVGKTAIDFMADTANRLKNQGRKLTPSDSTHDMEMKFLQN